MSFIACNSRRIVRRHHSRLRLVALEERWTPAVTSFGINAQHTGLSAVASQPVQAIHWQTPVDNFFSSAFGHYGAPLVTDANTVIYPFKVGNSPPNFHVLGRSGNNGAPVWDVLSDWTPAPHGWYPPYQPVLATATNRVYFAGAGGTIFFRTNPDSPTGTVTHLAFFGPLSDYLANKAAYDASVFVDTPLTADSQGNIFFGFRVTAANPGNLTSGIARISANGTGMWVSARTAAGGDVNIDWPAPNSAFALSNNGTTLYGAVRDSNTSAYGRLVALDTTTLATQHISGVLKDPRDGGTNNASVSSFSTASPMVAPDGRVFFGVLANPDNGSRGFLLQFSADLGTSFTPGGFGWDNTVSVVPASMVPQYTGSSSYLLFSKYNNYAIADGDGSNMIAVLDPNDTEVDFHPSANGLLIMKRILFKVGPTPDGPPPAVREWCINDAAVDPATNSVLVNSEDGKYYRWHLPTNTLTESVTLTTGIGQPYTMTIIGMDGTMYGIEDGILFALGKTPGLSVNDVTVPYVGTAATFTVTLDFPRTTAITVNYATADGSALAGVNYTATSGMLTFNPGQMSRTFTVPVIPQSVTGASANFFVNLSSPNNAVIVDGQGQATLLGQPARIQSTVVNDGSAQRSRVTSLTVTFSTTVSFAGAVENAFTLTRNGGSSVTFTASASTIGGETVVTLNNFSGSATDFGSLADGRYTLTALASQISAGGQALDGNGDGTPGDDYTFGESQGLFRFFGDINGDRHVDIADFGLFSSTFNLSTGQTGFLAAFDFNNDGHVDILDFGQFSLRIFTTLP
jgi:Calx-beta domain/Dockerin type I domain